MGILRMIWTLVKAFFVSRAALAAENIALRHQLTVLQRSANDPSSAIATESSGPGCLGSGPAGGLP